MVAGALALVSMGAAVGTAGMQSEDGRRAAFAVARQAFQLTPSAPAVSRPIIVDKTPTLTVSVAASSATLRVALVAPDGSRHVFSDAIAVTFESATYVATVVDPVPGTWSLDVSDPVPPTASIDVVVTATFNNVVRLALAGGEDACPVGTKVRLALALLDGVTRNRGVSITAKLSLPGDPTFDPASVTFTDNGTGADELAGDGIYEAFVNPGRAGFFELQLDVDGIGSTGTFHRSAATAIRVVARRAEITAFTGRGLDIDQDGLLDQIGVSPVATILESGDYLVAIRLRGSNGREIERSVESTLSTGVGSVEVLFDTADIISDIGVDGPYHVAQISFLRAIDGDVVPADISYDVGDTDAYQLASFERAPLRLTGSGGATGVDIHGSGLFGQLELTVDVLAEAAGAYSYAASLTDAAGNEIGFSAGSQTLESGTSAIVFQIPGEPIGRNGIDGPYCLSDLVIFGAGQSFIARQAFVTGPFEANRFEGFSGDATPRDAEKRQQLRGPCEPSNRREFSFELESLSSSSQRRGRANGQPKP